MVLRRTLEHFFPDAQLDVSGDRSIIDWDGSADETYYRLHDDPDGLGVEIEWLGTQLVFQPGNPSPLLATERHMVEVIVEAIDLRFRGLVQPGALAPLRSVSVSDRRPDRRRLSQFDRPLPDPRRPRGASGGRALDLREPQGLDRGTSCSAPTTIRPPRPTRTWRAHPASTLA